MLPISILAGLIPMFSWGIADFIQSVVIRKLGTYKTMFIANLFGLAFTLPFLLFFSVSIALPNLMLLVIGGICQTIAIYNFYRSLEIGEVSIVTPISASYTVITVLLLVLFLGQSISLFTFIAILMLVSGVVLVSTDLKKIKSMHAVRGVKESLITLMMWGIYFFILELVSNDITLFGVNFPATHYISVFFFSNISFGSFLMLFALYNKGIPKKSEFKDKMPFFILFCSTVLYTLAWLVLTYGFTVGDASIITPISSLYPAIIVTLAMIFYKEKLVLNQKVGILTILLGLVLISL